MDKLKENRLRHRELTGDRQRRSGTGGLRDKGEGMRKYELVAAKHHGDLERGAGCIVSITVMAVCGARQALR